MRPLDPVDQKPEIAPPVTPIAFVSPEIRDLILVKLRNSFILREFEEVASIFQNREDKLNQTITDLKNREDKLNLNNIHLKSQSQTLAKNITDLEKIALEKLQIEAELKKCKADCDEYKGKQISTKYELERVRLELKMLKEKEDFALERHEKKIADLEKEKEEENIRLRAEIVKIREDLERERVKNKEVVKLKEEIVGLINAKSKAEESARVSEKNLKQCEPRVKKLEDYVSMLCNHPVIAKIVEKVPSIHNPPVIRAHSVINGNQELVEPQKQSNLSNSDEKAHASPCAGSTADSPMVDTYGPPEAGPNLSDMAGGNKMPIENQDVIEIDDSDDEKPKTETASASKTGKDHGRSYEKDPAFKLISRGKRPLSCTKSNYTSTQNKKHKMDSSFPNKTSENSDSSDDSITTLDIDKFVSRIKNKPFKFEADMLSAFNKDDELCLNAVCALHRQEKSVKLPHAPQHRGFSAIDATRGYLLAKFLVDGDPQGNLRKSVEELQQYDSKGIDECRKLARNHSKQLFQIYHKEEDPIFKEYIVKNYSQKTIS